MPKMATKAADNVFYKARMEAAKWNDKLSSREGAAEVTGLDRTRIAYIELGTITPYPEEILILADCYNAPELCNHYPDVPHWVPDGGAPGGKGNRGGNTSTPVSNPQPSEDYG